MILEGIKAKNIRSDRIKMGSNRSINGGGGNGGRIKGKSNNDADRQISRRNDSKLK